MAITATYPAQGDRTPAARTQREMHWRRTLDRWRKSGLNQLAFCQRESVNPNVFNWWVRALRKRDEARSPRTAAQQTPRHRPRPAFVPVRVIEAAPSANATALEVLARGGRVVRVGPDFDPVLLRRVIAALEGLPC
jgi:hypothetical protein